MASVSLPKGSFSSLSADALQLLQTCASTPSTAASSASGSASSVFSSSMSALSSSHIQRVQRRNPKIFYKSPTRVEIDIVDSFKCSSIWTLRDFVGFLIKQQMPCVASIHPIKSEPKLIGKYRTDRQNNIPIYGWKNKNLQIDPCCIYYIVILGASVRKWGSQVFYQYCDLLEVVRDEDALLLSFSPSGEIHGISFSTLQDMTVNFYVPRKMTLERLWLSLASQAPYLSGEQQTHLAKFREFNSADLLTPKVKERVQTLAQKKFCKYSKEKARRGLVAVGKIFKAPAFSTLQCMTVSFDVPGTITLQRLVLSSASQAPYLSVEQQMDLAKFREFNSTDLLGPKVRECVQKLAQEIFYKYSKEQADIRKGLFAVRQIFEALAFDESGKRHHLGTVYKSCLLALFGRLGDDTCQLDDLFPS